MNANIGPAGLMSGPHASDHAQIRCRIPNDAPLTDCNRDSKGLHYLLMKRVQFDAHVSKLGCHLCSRLDASPQLLHPENVPRWSWTVLSARSYRSKLHVTSHTSSFQKF